MVTTNTDGNWKSVEGTLVEILNELNTDNVKKLDQAQMFHDGTNYVAVYYDG